MVYIKRLIVIARYGKINFAFTGIACCPPPLVFVPVQVHHKIIHQARLQQGFLIYMVIVIFLQAQHQFIGVIGFFDSYRLPFFQDGQTVVKVPRKRPSRGSSGTYTSLRRITGIPTAFAMGTIESDAKGYEAEIPSRTMSFVNPPRISAGMAASGNFSIERSTHSLPENRQPAAILFGWPPPCRIGFRPPYSFAHVQHRLP